MTDNKVHHFECKTNDIALTPAGNNGTMENFVVTLNVGGVLFKAFSSTLCSIPNTRLSRLCTKTGSKSFEEHFFDRNASVFECILEYYRSGELHLPNHICANIIKRELLFWEISPNKVSECCQDKMFEAEVTVAWKRKMAAKFAMKKPPFRPPDEQESCSERLKYRMWMIMENPESSNIGIVYGVIYSVFTLANVFAVMMSSTETFRIPTQNKTFVKFVQSKISNPKAAMYVTSTIHPAIEATSLACLLFFTVDLFARFLIYPSKIMFIKSFLNVSDITCLLMQWTQVVLTYSFLSSVDPMDNEKLRVIPLLLFLFSITVLRMGRLVGFAYHYPIMRVLLLSLVESWQILLLMTVVITVGMLTFAPLVFLAEFDQPKTFPNMLIACWWAIVTMTTVGYGDQYPMATGGYIIGALCALTGIILTALPIAIIGNNFTNLYSFYSKERERAKTEKQDESH